MGIVEELRSIINDFGVEILTDIRRLRALLADGGFLRGNVTRLCAVIETGAAQRFAATGALLDERAWRLMTDYVAEATDYDEDKTAEALAWALRALGVESECMPRDKEPLGAWVFNIDRADGYKLYKTRADGSEKTILCDAKVFVFTADDNFLYYTDMDSGIFRIDHDGGERFRVTPNRTWSMAAGGGWLYYANFNDDHSLYRVLPNGTGSAKLNDDESYDVAFDKGWLFYTNGSDNDRRYKIKSDGTGRVGL